MTLGRMAMMLAACCLRAGIAASPSSACASCPERAVDVDMVSQQPLGCSERLRVALRLPFPILGLEMQVRKALASRSACEGHPIAVSISRDLYRLSVTPGCRPQVGITVELCSPAGTPMLAKGPAFVPQVDSVLKKYRGPGFTLPCRPHEQRSHPPVPSAVR